jgi:hypothetical protein
MPTIWVREFTGGLDARRLPETSAGGTLIRATNCHINRGGEVEQRADFVHLYTAPLSATVGLSADRNGLVVFGHVAAGPTDLPSFIRYQQLQHPTGEALVAVPSTTLFEGRVQAVGQFADGSAYLFDDGVRVDDADAPPNLANSENPGALLTYQEKVFAGAGPVLFFSAIADPTNYNPASAGAGFIDLSTHTRGADEVTALARYQDFAAIFARRTIQIWFFDPDPTLSRQIQVLENTGTTAPKAVVPFGDTDVFYLDQSGIRSLRSRDISNNAFTTDIGSPVDPLVVADLCSCPTQKAASVIEPLDGRLWMSLRNRIYVFSYFPAARISAWSTYEPGFSVDDLVVFADRVYARAGDDFYVYGSQSGPYQYSDTVQAEAWLPYLDADRPSQAKMIHGIDASCRGQWEIRVGLEPERFEASDLIARVTGQTFNLQRVPVEARGNHIGLRFKSEAPVSATQPAVLSSVVIHHDLVDPEGA